jgi:hypothetical protein
MPKVLSDSLHASERIGLISKESVGLSYRPNLTANRIHVKRYVTGELTVRVLPIPLVDTTETRSKPPINSGERVQNGLSKKGKRQLRRSASFFQLLVEQNQTEKAFASMVTLTYGKHYPDDKTAKRDLDNFMKRLRRYFKGAFHYVWVAERQKRGAIHFHILTPNYTPKEWINNAWNEVVNNRLNDVNPEHVQTLYPNVKAVLHAGAYLTKYLQKEGENIIGNGYFVSHLTSKAIKPTFEQCYDVNQDKTNEVFETVENIRENNAYVLDHYDTDNRQLIWMSKTNESMFKEFVNYTLPKEHQSLGQSPTHPLGNRLERIKTH